MDSTHPGARAAVSPHARACSLSTDLPDLLRARTAARPDDLAYAFVRDDLSIATQLTFRQLDERASALAYRIAAIASPGQRVLLAYGAGLEFVCAFWACLYAGVVAIPAATSESGGLRSTLARLNLLGRDSGATLVLTTVRMRDLVTSQPERPETLTWLATDEVGSNGPAGNTGPTGNTGPAGNTGAAGGTAAQRTVSSQSASPGGTQDAANNLAYLQYTSGSTSAPRGVMITQANALANCAALSNAAGVDSSSRMLSWLPHFHDYGLVYGILVPVFAGCPAYLMAPITFVRRPLKWLEAVARFGITHTGAPNFAYGTCVQAVGAQPNWSADLACLTSASCGAEPINAATVTRFLETFAPFGLRPTAFSPAYGLAEATLGVTGKSLGSEVRMLTVSGEALGEGRVKSASADESGARTLVSCGEPLPGMNVVIVDPASGEPAEPDSVGEIRVSGPSVGVGYWDRAEASANIFGTALPGVPDRHYLRTGDLGFFHDGQLYVTGRSKDLLILHGRNHYPQDIEATVELADSAVRVGHGAAFCVDGPDGEQLVVVQEVRRECEGADMEAVVRAIRKAVADAHELPIQAVVLIRSGTIPRTTSGKIRRQSCKEQFMSRRLEVLHASSRLEDASASLTGTISAAELRSLASREQRRQRLEGFIAQTVARLTHQHPSAVSLKVSAVEAGLESLSAFRLLHDIEAALGVVLSAGDVLGMASLEGLIDPVLEQIESQAGAAAVHPSEVSARARSGDGKASGDTKAHAAKTQRLPASAPQNGVWVAEALSGRSPLFNLVYAVRIRGSVQVEALAKALQSCADRHSVLRTAFAARDGVLEQIVYPRANLPLPVVDLTAEPEPEAALREKIDDIARPVFDLDQAPLLRARLYRLGEHEHVMLLVFHHLIYDGWSHSILMPELAAAYEAFASGRTPEFPPLHGSYNDYVLDESARASPSELRKQLAFWKERLAGLQPTELLPDRPRTPRAGVHGGMERFLIPAERVAQLKELAKAENCTLFMVLLAAFQTLLMRYTNREDISVGSPVAGRTRSRFQDTVGFFSNTLVMRTSLSGNPSFRQLLARVRETALQAYANQDIPSDQLITELGIQRDPNRNALDPVGFALQTLPDVSLHLTGTQTQDINIHLGLARCDFSCALFEMSGALRGEMEYRTDLFDATTIQQLAAHFQRLLGGVVASPGATLDRLPLLEDSERRRILVEWNATDRQYPLDSPVHELFARQAATTPAAPAVILGDRQLSYAELNRRANRLAHRLRELGVSRDVPVGVCLERSLEMMVALLGVLKAGGAFLPLDPEYPSERLQLMLRDSGARVILTQKALTHVLAMADGATVLALDGDPDPVSHLPETDPDVRCSPDDLAYLIYTSGSTGQPKGVLSAHRGLTNLICWFVEQLKLTAADRVLQKTSISFDAALPELFGPLLVGAPVVLASPGEHRDVAHLARTLRDRNISVILSVPSGLRPLLDEPALAQCRSLRFIVCGGEPLDRELARDVYRRLPGVTFGNFYGPTEASDNATVCVLPGPPEGAGTLPIGKPIPNVRCYVLDRNLEPVPAGIMGELYIGGAGVARGYHNRPELTRERFLANPFREGERLYRTGDRARYRSDGHIEFLGRTDSQIKIRGFRVEPAEIEAALNALEGVRQSVVVAHEDPIAGKRLFAYVTGEAHDITALYAAVRERLPAHLIPAGIMRLAEFPSLPNGKIDRERLPAPQLEARHSPYVAPEGAAEQQLAAIWQEVLGQARIGAEDNFFELGGHSLLATQVVSRIRRRMQVEIPLRTLFESPSIRGLARRIAEERERTGQFAEPPIEPASRDRPLPLSFSQRRMWFIQQLEPRGTAYNMPFSTRLKGALSEEALQAALELIIERHEGFRTTFAVVDGEPVQIIAPSAPLQVRKVDLRNLPEDQRVARAEQIFREEALQPFDLASGPLFRFTLVRLGEKDHALLWLMHHSIGDQWSAGVISRELVPAYAALVEGKTPRFEPLSIQYADFAAWQRSYLGGSALDGQMAYWREKLRDVPVLTLPTDHSRPARQSYHGSWISETLTPETLTSLRRLSAERGTTPFMILLACFKMLLARYSGQKDIAVGSPVANRTRYATENLVGTLVNTLVMRTSLEGDPTFTELLARVRETALEAYAHQDVPFERVVEELGVDRDSSHSPLVQVLFNVPNAPMGDLGLAGLEVDMFDFDHGSAQFDLSITAETDHFGRVALSYSTDLFEADTARRMLQQFVGIIGQVVADPGRRLSGYGLLTQQQRRLMIVEWNSTQAEYPRNSRTDELITSQARRSPQAIAVGMGKRTLTYSALDARANQLAHFLRSRGVSSGTRVGVCLERSVEMVVALLAIMKCGAAYVPLDPAFPKNRLQFMAEDAGLAQVLTQRDLLGMLSGPWGSVCIDDLAREIGEQSTLPVGHVGSPDDPAYILYTSGSTGKPKGVEIPHGALTNFLWSMREKPGCACGDTLLAVTTLSFDISGLELYLPLISGARVELASRAEAGDPGLLIARFAACHATMMQATPATWRMLIQAGWTGDPGLKVLCGGEPLTRELADQLLDRCGTLWNMYGPTETTIWSTLEEIGRGSLISIGRPIANTSVYILDENLQPLPVGVAGELFIGGDGLAHGYRGRAELTREKFVADPFHPESGARLYRTGDLARFLPDGRLVHLGRMDMQVKIRGFRIELGEIESVLARHPAVAQVAVAARGEQADSLQLVAYLIARDREQARSESLRGALQESLPAYMIPQHFVFLDSFPLTANNKVDIRKLPAPADAPAAVESSQPVQPNSQLEVQLTALWRQVLGNPQLGIHDNFFESGGHSLKAVELFAHIHKLYGTRLPLATLFEAPTIARMAQLLERGGWDHSRRALVAIQPKGRAIPFFAVPGVGGDVLVFAKLAQLLGPDQPFYGLQARGLNRHEKPFSSIEEAGRYHLTEIRSVQPHGPYFLGGTCTGGVYAYEVAQRLMAEGEHVTLVIMESWHPSSYRRARRAASVLFPLRYLACKLALYTRELAQLPLRDWGTFLTSKARRAAALFERNPTEMHTDGTFASARLMQATMQAVAKYKASPYPGGILNIIAGNRYIASDTADTRRAWTQLAMGESRTVVIPAEDSGRLFVSPHVDRLAEAISLHARACLSK